MKFNTNVFEEYIKNKDGLNILQRSSVEILINNIIYDY